MKRILWCAIFLLPLCHFSYGQKQDTIHREWVKLDEELIASVKKLDKANPAAVEQFFLQFNNQPTKDSLGFGWTQFNPGKGGGYISINAYFFYYNNQIVSYSLYSSLPWRAELKEKYRKLFSELFPADTGKIYYLDYKEENIRHPLTEFKNARLNKYINPELLKYMSPKSGTMYGYAGGLPVTELPNRRSFNKLKYKLSNNDIITMMYAINPASRLTAIEYYFRNKTRFTNQPEIEKWIKHVYEVTPPVESIGGCIIYREKPQKLVEGYLSWQ